MMADWKKIPKMDRWESKDDQIDVGLRGSHGWTVVSIYGKFSDKKFKNRTGAIKWARAYMRKN